MSVVVTKNNKAMRWVSLLLVPALIIGCTKRPGGESSLFDNDGSGAMDKASWLEKVASALRNGDGIGPDEDVDALLAKSEGEIVDALLSDPRFGDTALSFNLFFLGRSVNKLKTKDQGKDSYTYDRSIFSSPQALASAKAVLDGGDYFELFEKDPKMISMPIGAPAGDMENGTTAADLRTKVRDDIQAMFEEAVAAFQPANPGEPLNKQNGCDKMSSNNYKIRQSLNAFGFSYELANVVMEKWTKPVLGYEPAGSCYDDKASAQEAETRIKSLRDSVNSLLTGMINTPVGSKIHSVKDLMTLSYEAPEGAGPLAEPFTPEGFWNNLKNSSTNFNRKRAAYVLRTYFCDDLTPINVEVPMTHTGNAHATDPACQACHYKLDPMGGLFRYHGRGGTDYQAANNYVFDDFKSIFEQEYSDYLSSWKNDQGEWKVGYYVGANKPHSKWKGDQLSDLWTFFKQSKEVKQCLVRRMAEYFLGPDQVYDAGWLDEISASMKPGATSAQQFKGVVKSLVTSNTFKQADPVAGKCYDFESDDDASGDERAPCEIAHIVKKRCAGCHTDAEDLGVDFTTWKKLDDGTYGFVHLNENRDAQITRQASLKMILDRITSTDPSYRMPQGGSMSELEKQTLYKWLDREINGVN